mmetsp:Transcript_24784/g.63948  ORF Transcript_24784/g.63948 Transcript_24784/m.63948 type:complete len:228 (-) Transcript_24784:650-1333(-)
MSQASAGRRRAHPRSSAPRQRTVRACGMSARDCTAKALAPRLRPAGPWSQARAQRLQRPGTPPRTRPCRSARPRAHGVRVGAQARARAPAGCTALPARGGWCAGTPRRCPATATGSRRRGASPCGMPPWPGPTRPALRMRAQSQSTQAQSGAGGLSPSRSSAARSRARRSAGSTRRRQTTIQRAAGSPRRACARARTAQACGAAAAGCSSALAHTPAHKGPPGVHVH